MILTNMINDYFIYKEAGRVVKMSDVKYYIDKSFLPWYKQIIVRIKHKLGLYKKFDNYGYRSNIS